MSSPYPSVSGKQIRYFLPQRLPDGWVLFTIVYGEGEAKVAVQHPASDERIHINQISSSARYIDSGHLLYGLGEAIAAVPFDLRRHEITGPPISLAPELTSAERFNETRLLDVSREGTLIYWHAQPETSLTVVASDGTSEPLASGGHHIMTRIAPGGERLAVEQLSEGGRDLWIYSMNGAAPPVKLTFAGDNRYPVWTPDGERIIFTENAADWRIVWTASDGSQLEPELLLRTVAKIISHSWMDATCSSTSAGKRIF